MFEGMHDRDLYATILGIRAPWQASEVSLKATESTVEVMVSLATEAATPCPQCGRPSPRYDAKPRRWRHLDTCQFKTFITADVPCYRSPNVTPLSVKRRDPLPQWFARAG